MITYGLFIKILECTSATFVRGLKISFDQAVVATSSAPIMLLFQELKALKGEKTVRKFYNENVKRINMCASNFYRKWNIFLKDENNVKDICSNPKSRGLCNLLLPEMEIELCRCNGFTHCQTV